MLKAHTVFIITVARFKIGHTQPKLPGIPPATFSFIAYLRSHARYILSRYMGNCKHFANLSHHFGIEILAFSGAVFVQNIQIITEGKIIGYNLQKLLHYAIFNKGNVDRVVNSLDRVALGDVDRI